LAKALERQQLSWQKCTEEIEKWRNAIASVKNRSRKDSLADAIPKENLNGGDIPF
jgi:hypothetical protein